MKQIFYGADIFDGHTLIKDHAVLIEHDQIIAVMPVNDRPQMIKAHDLMGGILAPGFIDVQVNGGGGVLLNETPTVEGIETITRAHRRFGTTHLLPTVITDDQKILDAALDASHHAMDRVAGSLGLHIEGPFIDQAKRGAHPEHHIRPLTDVDLARLAEFTKGVRLITVAPNRVMPGQIRALVDAGLKVSLGHSNANDREALAAFDAGAHAVTHLFNAMSPLEGRAPGLVGAALADRRVICGLIADGHHVAPTAIKAALNAKGPHGIALVSDAMPSAAGGPDHFMLQNRPVTRTGTRLTLPDGTLAGATITMLDAIQYLAGLGVPLADILTMATLTPARMIGVEGQFGQIRPGFSASFVHLDADLTLRGVIMDGQTDF